MKLILLLFLCSVMFMGCGYFVGYGIHQKVTKNIGKGYNVETLLWKDGDIVWSHYTFQEWGEPYHRLYIPVDSIMAVKTRDYAEAKRVMNIFKQSNFKKTKQ